MCKLPRYIIFWDYTIDKTKKIQSEIDNENYQVHKNHPDHEEAANTMALLNSKAIKVMKYLSTLQRTTFITNLLDRYNFDKLIENSPKNPSGDTSYTISKGRKLAICLRNSDSGDFHDLNTLFFVMLHELTHIGLDINNHPPIFWRTFKYLLEKAYEIDEIILINYQKNPTKYCGMVIDYNPIFDHTLDLI
uniref:D6-00329 homolog protein n=1 Tax=Abalone asfa-like virus TaxID=2839893 RepID=A0A5K7XZ92_9VIRU|nr:D6-00329 homolog protein [Abalone asfa-like virus]